MTTELKEKHVKGEEVPSLFHSTCCAGLLSFVYDDVCGWPEEPTILISRCYLILHMHHKYVATIRLDFH